MCMACVCVCMRIHTGVMHVYLWKTSMGNGATLKMHELKENNGKSKKEGE